MPYPTFRDALRFSRPVILTIAVFVTLRDQLGEIDTVYGDSMSPTLSPDSRSLGHRDRVIIKRFGVGLPGGIKRGDIVTFWKPHKPEEISIKRVIALDGDEVWPRDREMGTAGGYGGHGVRKNYVPEDEQIFISQPVVTSKGNQDLSKHQEPKSFIVPYGYVWVEGDNWRGSYDSNDFGPISKALIDGKALGILRNWRIEKIPERKMEKGATRIKEGIAVIPEVLVN